MPRLLCLAALIAAVVLAVTPIASANTLIDTTGSLQSPPDLQNCFEAPHKIFGQVVTVPASDTTLRSFTFYMQQGSDIQFRGEVYRWDASAHVIVGPALWSSAIQTTSSSTAQPVTFSPGLSLTAGGRYVLLASTRGINQSQSSCGRLAGCRAVQWR